MVKGMGDRVPEMMLKVRAYNRRVKVCKGMIATTQCGHDI